jgi:phosphoserine phosphatase RsbU/P
MQRFSEVIAGSRILVVDDTAFNRDLLGTYLMEAGLRDIVYAADGYQALDAIRADPPDLLILDIMMPGLDGFEVCRMLRADPATAEMPILVQTALTSSEDRNKAFTVGATDLVPKPIDPNELIARVRIHLENRRLIGDLRQYRMRVEGELDIARSMFDQLLPSEGLCRTVGGSAGVVVRHRLMRGSDLCGDLWGLLPIDGKRFGVFLADIPGRGLSAALCSFRLHTLIGEVRGLANEPAALLRELNERSVPLREPGDHASILYGVVDTEHSIFRYSGAAATNPAVLSASGQAVGEATGLPIAIAPGVAYRERLLPFPPGAALVLHSNAVLDTLPGRDLGWLALLEQAVEAEGIENAFGRVAEAVGRAASETPADDHTLIWIGRPDAGGGTA